MKLTTFALLTLSFCVLNKVECRGGAPKCSTCPSCMKCNPLIGCVFDNYQSCVTPDGKFKGTCFRGICDTKLKVPSIPPICKVWHCNIKNNCTLGNEVSGIDCTPTGSLVNYACFSGKCKPFVDGLDKLGNNVGCQFFIQGTLCDTNGVLTDGEICVNGLCVYPPAGPQCIC